METTDSRLHLNDENLHDLNEMRKWTFFLAILGFIGVAFMVIAALFIGSFIDASGQEMPVPHGALTGLYLLFAIIYFFPILYLYKFSTSTKKAVHEKSEYELTSAFTNLKRHYKFIGIIAIVMLTVYVLVILFALLGAAIV
ncbi:MAG: DUF5362 family protein [Candidatus Cyclobacteriaceae bacterium M2_1C_046]